VSCAIIYIIIILYHMEVVDMPSVSFYLNQKSLDAIRARAKAHKVPVSRVIREAVEQYLKISDTKAARENVLNVLTTKRPFGGIAAWDELHRERTEADNDRG
jgi:hypothetical protein